jgi:hypothetical protein
MQEPLEIGSVAVAEEEHADGGALCLGKEEKAEGRTMEEDGADKGGDDEVPEEEVEGEPSDVEAATPSEVQPLCPRVLEALPRLMMTERCAWNQPLLSHLSFHLLRSRIAHNGRPFCFT